MMQGFITFLDELMKTYNCLNSKYRENAIRSAPYIHSLNDSFSTYTCNYPSYCSDGCLVYKFQMLNIKQKFFYDKLLKNRK